MKLLIIGSEGFIGRHCVSYFSAQGWQVYGCDLLDYASQNYHYTKISRLNPDFDRLFDGAEYNYCINAAGSGSVPASIEQPLTDFDANCYDVIRLLELIRLKASACKYLHISSAAVYGNPETLPVTEQAALAPLSPYGYHKLIAETICAEYSNLHKLDIKVARPFSVYGPGLRKQLFWDLYQKCKTQTEEIILWGDGTESRDLIYIADLVAAFAMILTDNTKGLQIFNVASGTEISVARLAELFYAALKVNTPIKFNNHTRPGDPRNWRADISGLQKLGFKQSVTIEEGLKLTAAWIEKLD